MKHERDKHIGDGTKVLNPKFNGMTNTARKGQKSQDSKQYKNHTNTALNGGKVNFSTRTKK